MLTELSEHLGELVTGVVEALLCGEIRGGGQLYWYIRYYPLGNISCSCMFTVTDSQNAPNDNQCESKCEVT